MELQRPSTRLAPTRAEPPPNGQPAVQDEESLAGLATRLAQQGLELAAVELRRLGGEVRERRRHAVRVVVALYLVRTFAALGLAVLAVGAVLMVGRMLDDYGIAALATGGVLLLAGIISAMVLTSAAHRVAGSSDDSDDRDA